MFEKEARELLETVKNLTQTANELTAENARLKQKLERMNELLLNAQRARFGQSSEKRGYTLPESEQLRLFNEAEREQDEKAEEPLEKTLVAAHERKKRTNAELIKGLPIKERTSCHLCHSSQMKEPDKSIGECPFHMCSSADY